MRADREIQMQMLAALHAFEEYALEVGHLRQVRQHGVARTQHQPAAADIAPAGLRIDRVVDRRREIRRAVELVLHVERQLGRDRWRRRRSRPAAPAPRPAAPRPPAAGSPSGARIPAPDCARRVVPNAAAWRRRLPPTAPTISKCSGPASLNSVALGEASIMALMSASAIGSSWISTSPMPIRCSTKRRSRNFSRSTPAMVPALPAIPQRHLRRSASIPDPRFGDTNKFPMPSFSLSIERHNGEDLEER